MVPISIKKLGDKKMVLTWADGRTGEFDAVSLRQNCRCAGCRDELTGKPILDPSSVSPDLTIKRSEIMGNYALSFLFSDGHGSGIYTFDWLSRHCGENRRPGEGRGPGSKSDF